MYDRILCAVGGPDPSFAPARAAARLARQLGSSLTFVSVHRPTSELLGEPDYSATLVPRVAEAQRTVAQASDIAMAEGLPHPPDTEVLAGDPVERISTLARDGRYSLIVMGTHRRSRVGAALLGSVSAAVGARAGRPVLIVPEGTAEVATDESETAAMAGAR